jgi:hypothetical protein
MPKAYGLMALITAFACGGVMKLYVDIVYDGNGSRIWGNSVEEYFSMQSLFLPLALLLQFSSC